MNSKCRTELAEPVSLDKPEISGTSVAYHAVGGYNYTNLAYAITEAKRARRLRQSR